MSCCSDRGSSPSGRRKGIAANNLSARKPPTRLIAVGLVLLAIAVAAFATWPRPEPQGVASVAPTVAPSSAAPVALASATPADEPVSAPAAAQREEQVAVVAAQDGLIRIATSDLADGRAHFYTLQGAQKAIPFFLLKSSDGVIRAAFDACDVCFSAKKGFHQEGDEMVCNNCGSRFPSNQINVVRGGCNPSPLTREVQGDTVIIRVTDIGAGAQYF